MYFNLFYTEVLFSFMILSMLVFNSTIINSVKYDRPILFNEIFFQTLFFLFCLIIFFIFFKIESYYYNLLFLQNSTIIKIKIFIVFIAIVLCFSIFKGYKIQKLNFFEFYTFFLLFLFSCLLLLNTLDLISIYLLLEMQTFCFYIMASFLRKSSSSSEAGLKYFIYGSIISCFLLLGFSLIYTTLGTLNLAQIELFLNYKKFNMIIKSAAFLIFCTFFFKLSIFPFHFWSPDIYEGSPLSATVVFAILPKIVLVYILIKFIFSFGNNFTQIKIILKLFGFLSIIIGTFLSLKQKRLKRFIIYSSIGQSGFIAIALGIHTFESFVYTFFFLIIYIISSILIWSYLLIIYETHFEINNFRNTKKGSFFISNLLSSSNFNYLGSLSFIFIFFSMSGIPPLSGFLSKALILLETIHTKDNILAICIIIISSISMFYYIRIIKIIFFEPVQNKYNSIPNEQMIIDNNLTNFIYFILVCCLICLIFFFFKPSLLFLFSNLLIDYS